MPQLGRRSFVGGLALAGWMIDAAVGVPENEPPTMSRAGWHGTWVRIFHKQCGRKRDARC